MLTEQQVETAARKLCELRGIDPDALVSHCADPSPQGYIPAILLHSPAWTRAKREVVDHWRLTEALRVATEQPNA